MMTQPLPIAGKLPIKTLVARQLPTKNIMLYETLIIVSDTYMRIYNIDLISWWVLCNIKVVVVLLASYPGPLEEGGGAIYIYIYM